MKQGLVFFVGFFWPVLTFRIQRPGWKHFHLPPPPLFVTLDPFVALVSAQIKRSVTGSFNGRTGNFRNPGKKRFFGYLTEFGRLPLYLFDSASLPLEEAD